MRSSVPALSTRYRFDEESGFAYTGAPSGSSTLRVT